MNRRFFLKSTFSPTKVTPLTPSERKSDTFGVSTHIANYYSESGLVGIHKHFVSGMLSIDSRMIDEIEEVIEEMREEENYWVRLSYSSNDRFKLPLSKRLIEFFIEEMERVVLYIKVREFDSSEITNELDIENRLSIREENVTAFLSEVASDMPFDSSSIVMKRENWSGPSSTYINSFLLATGSTFEAISTRDSQIIQMVDLLVGTIACEVKGGSRSTTKNALLQVFRSALGVSSLTASLLQGNNKIVFI